MLRIDLSVLDEGVHELRLRPEAESLGLEAESFGDIEVSLRLDYAEQWIVASFEVSGFAILECDRTLAPYRQPLSGTHCVTYLSPDRIGPDPDDSLQPLPDSATVIDLTDVVRDTLLLSIPLRHVAPEAEELKISTVFGSDSTAGKSSIDDRWAALEALRTKNSA